MSHHSDPILPHPEAGSFIIWLSYSSGQAQFPGLFLSLGLAGSISSKFPSDPLGCEGFSGKHLCVPQTLNWRHFLSVSDPSGPSEHYSLHNFLLWLFEMRQESTLRRHYRIAVSVPDPLLVCLLWAVEVWVSVPGLRDTTRAPWELVGAILFTCPSPSKDMRQHVLGFLITESLSWVDNQGVLVSSWYFC